MNIGMIGCGFIGQKHLTSLRALEKVRLVAVSDIMPDRMEQMTQKYVTARPSENRASIHQYSNYEKLLEDPEVEVVVITTLSGLHAQMALQALQLGKHVIIEKPMSLSIQDARAISRLAKEKGKKVAVCHQKRFFPHLQHIRKLVRDGKLGRLIFGGVTLCYNRDDHYYQAANWRGTWNMDGGVLLNQAIHNVDLLLWMMASPCTVLGQIARIKRSIEAEDTALAVLKMNNNSLARIEATVCADGATSHERLVVYGSRGSFSLSGKYFETIEKWNVEGEEQPTVQMLDPYQALYRDFAQALQEDREPYVNGEEGMLALEVIFGAYRSAQTGTLVQLPLDEFSTTDMKHFFDKK